MLYWIIVFAVAWPAYWLLKLFLVTRNVLGLKFCPEKPETFPADGVPDVIREVTGAAVTDLEALGFHSVGGWITSQTVDQRMRYRTVVLIHNLAPIVANIRLRETLVQAGRCWIYLRTALDSGRVLATVNYDAQGVLPSCSNIDILVMPDANGTALMQAHQARLNSVADVAQPMADLSAVVAFQIAQEKRSFGEYKTLKLISEVEPNVYTLRFGPAVRAAARALRRVKLIRKSEQGNRLRPVMLSENARGTIEMETYRSVAAVRAGKMSPRNKGILTLISFLAFAGVMALRASPVIGVTIVLGLIIHEGGHLLAMRWFGHRDTQLLFIPFLGGLALSLDAKVLKPWQHVVIIILGPLPGIFAAATYLIFGGPDGPAWAEPAAETLLLFNLFNLLPFFPLDGGQIIDYALISRFPRIRVVFVAGSAIAILLAAIVLSTPALALLGVIPLSRLGAEWRLARVRRALRSEFPKGGEEEAVAGRAFVHMREPEWSKVSVSRRAVHAQHLQASARSLRPGFGTLVFAMVAYSSPLWLPLALYAGKMSISFFKSADSALKGEALATPHYKKPSQEFSGTNADNAAVDCEEASTLLESESSNPANFPVTKPRVVSLLRTAANKTGFAPVATGADVTQFSKERWNEQLPLILLAQAQDELHAGATEQAWTLVLDAMKLARLMDKAPDWWTWKSHAAFVSSSWEMLEKILARGERVPTKALEEFSSFATEAYELEYAQSSIPGEQLRRIEKLQRIYSNSAEKAGKWSASNLLFRMMSGNADSRGRGRSYQEERDEKLQRQLEAVRQGSWPKIKPDGKVEVTDRQILELSDLTLRLRIARIGILISQRRANNIESKSIASLAIMPAETVNPLSGEPIILQQIGATDVLTCQKSDVPLWPGYSERDIEWRLPNYNGSPVRD